MKKHLEEMMKKKSFRNPCKSRVIAAGFSKRGNLIAMVSNKPTKNQYVNPHSHAEFQIMCIFGKKIKKILIARFGRSGDRLPISPCSMCATFAKRLGITIEEI